MRSEYSAASRPDGQDLLLLLAGPRFAVLRRDGQAGSVAAVGAAAVPQRAGEHDDGSGGHHDLDDVGVVERRGPRRPTDGCPGMTSVAPFSAVNSSIAQIALDTDRRARPTDPVEVVVDVELLRRLARQQVDRQVGGQQEIGEQELVEHRQHPRMLDQRRDRGCLGEQRVHAVRQESLEVVAAPERVVPEPRRELGPDAFERVGVDRVLEHDVPVALVRALRGRPSTSR